MIQFFMEEGGQAHFKRRVTQEMYFIQFYTDGGGRPKRERRSTALNAFGFLRYRINRTVDGVGEMAYLAVRARRLLVGRDIAVHVPAARQSDHSVNK